jgi:prepilin-type N-terminal cleavage/methylation domain-containing protein
MGGSGHERTEEMKSVFSHEGYVSALPRFGRRSHPSEGGLVRRSSKSEGGVTLVELIAVLAIISILTASVIGAIVYASRKASVAGANALLERLSVAINIYREDYAAYPPDGQPEGGWDDWYIADNPDHPGVPNLTSPAETLYYFLEGFFLEPDPPFQDDERLAMPRQAPYTSFGEKDLRRSSYKFRLTTSLTEISDDGNANDDFPEIVDPWGTPIYYAAHDDFDLAENDPNGPGDSRDTRDPVGNEEDFDLVSRGPDRLVYFTTAEITAEEPDRNSYVNLEREVQGKRPNRDNVGNFRLEELGP